MQCTITYLLTEQAQKDAIAKLGQPVSRKQIVTDDVPAEFFDRAWSNVSADGAVSFDLAATIPLAVIGVPAHSFEFRALQVLTGVEALMAFDSAYARRTSEIRAERERKSAEEEAKRAQDQAAEEVWIDMFFADPAARGSISRGSICVYSVPGEKLATDSGYSYTHEIRYGYSYTHEIRYSPRRAELAAEIERRETSDKAAKEAAEVERESAKEQYIAAWVAEHADPDVREQFAAGIACRKEIVAMIAQHAFAAIGMPDEQKWDDDFCRSSSCPCGENTVSCLPRSVYPAWKATKDQIPADATVEFTKVRECLREDWDGDGESASEPQYYATITMPAGPFRFDRTVRLG